MKHGQNQLKCCSDRTKLRRTRISSHANVKENDSFSVGPKIFDTLTIKKKTYNTAWAYFSALSNTDMDGVLLLLSLPLFFRPSEKKLQRLRQQQSACASSTKLRRRWNVSSTRTRMRKLHQVVDEGCGSERRHRVWRMAPNCPVKR